MVIISNFAIRYVDLRVSFKNILFRTFHFTKNTKKTGHKIFELSFYCLILCKATLHLRKFTTQKLKKVALPVMVTPFKKTKH